MLKISSGIRDLDTLLDSLHEGDNVVWEVEAGTSVEGFIRNFIHQSLQEEKDVIYVSFNKSPQSILKRFAGIANHKKFVLLDAFTAGKGKNDKTFLKFYESRTTEMPRVIKVDKPSDIDTFTDVINSIQDNTTSSARYVFDSITGMQDLWNEESITYKFFTYMCPRLYDLDTVAYWILEKDAHSQAFKANLRHITQVVIDLFKKGEDLFLKTLKLDNRTNRQSFKSHKYELDAIEIRIKPYKRELPFNIGTKLREYRIKLDMSQKELADKVGLTPSFLSQMENNQISPSLNSFMQICSALNISPVSVWQEKMVSTEWLITKNQALSSLEKKEKSVSTFAVARGERISSFLALISPQSIVDGHFLYHKGEELIHVLRGNVSVVIERDRKELKPGDTIFLTDDFPTQWNNEKDHEVELFIVCS
jgi:KaiC/GvpD/RAD55 family RecA-like ATPase/quercetin dioxygenase-like cupin family protein